MKHLQACHVSVTNIWRKPNRCFRIFASAVLPQVVPRYEEVGHWNISLGSPRITMLGHPTVVGYRVPCSFEFRSRDSFPFGSKVDGTIEAYWVHPQGLLWQAILEARNIAVG